MDCWLSHVKNVQCVDYLFFADVEQLSETFAYIRACVGVFLLLQPLSLFSS